MTTTPIRATPQLRLATPDDAAQIAAIYTPILRETPISFEVDEVAPHEMAQRIEHTLQRYPWVVADADGDVLGYAYATRHRERAAYDWSVDVSVYLAPQARRRGIGTALYVALLDLLAAQGFANAFAGIALPNEASVRLHESVGFTPVGVYRAVGWKFGAWHDVGWWQRRLLPTDTVPQRPRPIGDLPEATLADAFAAGAEILRRRERGEGGSA